MNELHQEKKLLRQEVKRRKSLQSPEDYYIASEKIFHKVELLPKFINSGVVLVYWSLPGEVFTHEFVKTWSAFKRIMLPSVDGENMLIKEYKSENALIPGDLYGIPEPGGPLFTNYELIDLVIVPGVAFDINHNRMGRGKAYYDRFLAGLTVDKVGVCFDFQLFDNVPIDENDIRMDVVITDKP